MEKFNNIPLDRRHSKDHFSFFEYLGQLGSFFFEYFGQIGTFCCIIGILYPGQLCQQQMTIENNKHNETCCQF